MVGKHSVAGVTASLYIKRYVQVFDRWSGCKITEKKYSERAKTEKCIIKVWLNRYSWGAGKVGSEYSSWFIWLECISWRCLTMSRLSKCLYHVRSCRNSSEYSKTSGNFLPLLIIRLAHKIVWDIFNIISSDVALLIFKLCLWCFSSRDILIEGGGSSCRPLISKCTPKIKQNGGLHH